MTKREAKQFACAWIAADLEAHSGASFHEDDAADAKIRSAVREVILEMLQRAGPFGDRPHLGPRQDWKRSPSTPVGSATPPQS